MKTKLDTYWILCLQTRFSTKSSLPSRIKGNLKLQDSNFGHTHLSTGQSPEDNENTLLQPVENVGSGEVE